MVFDEGRFPDPCLASEEDDLAVPGGGTVEGGAEVLEWAGPFKEGHGHFRAGCDPRVRCLIVARRAAVDQEGYGDVPGVRILGEMLRATQSIEISGVVGPV